MSFAANRFSVLLFPRHFLVLLMLACLGLTGCSSKYGTQQTKVNHYPDCYEPIADLRHSEFAVAESTATGAIIGGLVGALGGYLATGKASGAAVGAAAGAAVGGAAGYYKAASQREKNDSARLTAYADDLDESIGLIDKDTAAARVARSCYERQFAVAASEFKAGHITKEQFNSRYIEVRSGLEEAAYILGENNKHNEQLAAQYRHALDSEAQRMGVPKQALNKKPAQTPRKSAPATPAAPAEPPLSKEEQRQAEAQLATEEGQKLTKVAARADQMEEALAGAREEERQLRERLAATNQAAEDLMS